jgi:hypothetical protein
MLPAGIRNPGIVYILPRVLCSLKTSNNCTGVNIVDALCSAVRFLLHPAPDLRRYVNYSFIRQHNLTSRAHRA